MTLIHTLFAVALFSSGFVLAAHLTGRSYVCSVPVKTITFVKTLE